MAEQIGQVSDDNFETEVLQAGQPVLVDFWAPWCGPCKQLGPVLESFAAKHGDKVRVVKLNTDNNMTTAGRYNVMSIPTLILFQEGKEKGRLAGYMPAEELERKVLVQLDG